MVLYKCEKCNKEFIQKSNYITHINKKISCEIKNIISYKCEKCNKEFNLKSNYITHINKKNSCETKNIISYKCEKCNKEFNQKSNYVTHINKKIPCNGIFLDDDNNKLLLKINELNNTIDLLQNKNIILEQENIKINEIKYKNIILKQENIKINELYNNLLDKCIKNSTNTTTTNNSNNTNTINNTINITLTNFGNEDYNKLTNDEQLKIFKSNKQCMSNLIKYLHVNDRLPQYKNICIKNLRGKGGYLYEGNKWSHCNFENLLTILFKNKINDLEKIKSNNEELSNFYIQNIQNLIDNYDDDIDTFIKNNKDNIINMLYNNTKNYKITN
jgi:uncharacterized C2H2 Zn-finger protein